MLIVIAMAGCNLLQGPTGTDASDGPPAEATPGPTPEEPVSDDPDDPPNEDPPDDDPPDPDPPDDTPRGAFSATCEDADAEGPLANGDYAGNLASQGNADQSCSSYQGGGEDVVGLVEVPAWNVLTFTGDTPTTNTYISVVEGCSVSGPGESADGCLAYGNASRDPGPELVRWLNATDEAATVYAVVDHPGAVSSPDYEARVTVEAPSVVWYHRQCEPAWTGTEAHGAGVYRPAISWTALNLYSDVDSFCGWSEREELETFLKLRVPAETTVLVDVWDTEIREHRPYLYLLESCDMESCLDADEHRVRWTNETAFALDVILVVETGDYYTPATGSGKQFPLVGIRYE